MKTFFSENTSLKILSLVFATLLWAYVESQGRIEMNFTVPLELLNLPDALVISSEVVEHVDVQLRGKETHIRNVSSNQISVYLDLSEGREGENRFELSKANASVPSNVEVTEINPKNLSIYFKPIPQKKMSLLPELKGKIKRTHLLIPQKRSLYFETGLGLQSRVYVL